MSTLVSQIENAVSGSDQEEIKSLDDSPQESFIELFCNRSPDFRDSQSSSGFQDSKDSTDQCIRRQRIPTVAAKLSGYVANYLSMRPDLGQNTQEIIEMEVRQCANAQVFDLII